MFANISPASYNYEETVGTLRYASRAKLIKNAPKINEDPLDAELRKYEAEIKALKEQLANGGSMPRERKIKKKKKKKKKKMKIMIIMKIMTIMMIMKMKKIMIIMISL